WPPSVALLLRMTLALACTGALAVIGGLVMVATAHSLGHFIARAFPVSIVLYLPYAAHFGLVDGWPAWVLFGWNPGHAMLRALLWAAEPGAVAPHEAAYAFGYMALAGAILFRWALILHARTIGHAAA